MKNLNEMLKEAEGSQNIVTIQIDLDKISRDILYVFADDYTYRSAYDKFVALDNICDALLMFCDEKIVRKILKLVSEQLPSKIDNENNLKYYKSNLNKKIKWPKMKLRD